MGGLKEIHNGEFYRTWQTATKGCVMYSFET